MWEAYRERANLERKQKESDLRTIDGRLGDIQEELGQEDARRTKLAEVERDLKTLSTSREQQSKLLDEAKKLQASLKGKVDMLNTLGSQLEASTQNRDHNLDLLNQRREEMASYQSLLKRAGEIEQAHADWQVMRKQLEALDKVAEQFRAYQDHQQEPLRQIEAERARLGQEISHLESNLEALEANESLLPMLNKQLEAAEAEIKKCQQQISQRAAIEEEINQLNQERADARAENPRLKAEMEDLRSRLDQLEKTDEATCPVCKKPLSEKDRQVMIAQYYAEGNDRKARFRANEALLKDFDLRMAQKEAAINGLRQADDALRNATRQADQAKDRIGQVRTQRDEWDANSAPFLAELRKTLSGEHFLPEARKVLAGVEAELKTLGYDAGAHNALRQKEMAAREVESEFSDLGKARAAMAPLGRQVKDLETQLQKAGQRN